MHTNDPTEVQRVEDTLVVDVFKVVGRADLPTHTALVFDRKHERSACHDTSETQQRLSQNKKNAANTARYRWPSFCTQHKTLRHYHAPSCFRWHATFPRSGSVGIRSVAIHIHYNNLLQSRAAYPISSSSAVQRCSSPMLMLSPQLTEMFCCLSWVSSLLTNYQLYPCSGYTIITVM